jgi:RND family efflux transporter MFP subunit
MVTAPGRTDALKQDRVRAPFPARLVRLNVTDGDRVGSGDVLAEVVSKNSEAAVFGAESMLAAAHTEAERDDAQRAVAIAKRNLVQQPLHAPAAGVVLSHGAEAGDYLDEGEVLLTIAEAGAVIFDAQVSQADVARVRPGDHATIEIPATGTTPTTAVVHGVLPAASSENLSAPMRLDFLPVRPSMQAGLFGTAQIIVGEHAHATVVPDSAVLTDDITGTKRLALAGDDRRAHWIVVQTGLTEAGRVEILSPKLSPGQRVIVSGQVGLPDSSRISIAP